MEIVNREVVCNRVIVNVNNEVEMIAFDKLLDMSGVRSSESFDKMILLNLFGINVKDRKYKASDFRLNIGDLELIGNLNISEFKVLRECGKLKTEKLLLWNDVEVFLSKFTVNEFKFVGSLLRELDYFDEVVFLDNRENEYNCNEDDYVGGCNVDNDYSVAC